MRDVPPRMGHNYEAIIFDLYGTLAYIGEPTGLYQKLFRSLGLDRRKAARARKLALTLEYEDIAHFVHEVAPGNCIDTAPYQQLLERELSSVHVYPESTEVLEDVRSRGLKTGLISNVATPYTKPFYDMGLERYFDSVLFSCEQGVHKPSNAIFERVLERLDVVPERTALVGDSYTSDVAGAVSAGIHGFLLSRGGSSEEYQISSLYELLECIDTI